MEIYGAIAYVDPWTHVECFLCVKVDVSLGKACQVSQLPLIQYGAVGAVVKSLDSGIRLSASKYQL